MSNAYSVRHTVFLSSVTTANPFVHSVFHFIKDDSRKIKSQFERGLEMQEHCRKGYATSVFHKLNLIQLCSIFTRYDLESTNRRRNQRNHSLTLLLY